MGDARRTIAARTPGPAAAAPATRVRSSPATALAADPDRGAPAASGGRPGRVRRFVRRYGWRAYAVPLLTMATIAASIDLALDRARHPVRRPATRGRRAGPSLRRARPIESVPTAPAAGRRRARPRRPRPSGRRATSSAATGRCRSSTAARRSTAPVRCSASSSRSRTASTSTAPGSPHAVGVDAGRPALVGQRRPDVLPAGRCRTRPRPASSSSG